jgi:hypothetical protein
VRVLDPPRPPGNSREAGQTQFRSGREKLMKRLVLVLVLLGAGAVGLGFYLGWFRVGSDSADGKSNVTLSVDTDKFQEDGKKAVANVQDLGRQIKDKVAGPSEKSMDGTVVSVSGDKLTMTTRKERNRITPWLPTSK